MQKRDRSNMKPGAAISEYQFIFHSFCLLLLAVTCAGSQHYRWDRPLTTTPDKERMVNEVEHCKVRDRISRHHKYCKLQARSTSKCFQIKAATQGRLTKYCNQLKCSVSKYVKGVSHSRSEGSILWIFPHEIKQNKNKGQKVAWSGLLKSE